MNGKCNQISLDEAQLMGILRQDAKDALALEGDRLLSHMRREVRMTTHGGAPGKPDWRAEITQNLGHVATAVTGDSVSMDFGYSPSDKPDEVRAMIVVDGSGSAAGGTAIHAGPTGRSVWNDDVSGKHPSRAMGVYDLPEEFNQKRNRFVENALRMMQKEFGHETENVFSSTPDSAYYENVRVTDG